jgi:NAD(P)-dependent dehydrogenase (short-subunit alcohol dehydrogenase family)
MTKALENRIALVTGGSTGIGAAVALELAENGAQVLITGRSEATLRASAERHRNIAFVVADIAEPATAARSIEQVKKRWDRLDILVNNAGIFELAPLAGLTSEHVRRTFATNVEGLIETTRLALPLLKASKGNIVNVTTIVADQPFANMSVYCASKAAVLALTRAWAQELGPDGVRVNAVSPGPIETPIFSVEKLGLPAAELQGLAASILSQVPLGRFGKPEEVARVIGFVASPAASYVTGSQFSVGGGIEA